MSDDARVVEMYDRHPISAAGVLARLAESRSDDAPIRPEHLFGHDQDHYGGLAANDRIAALAGMKPGQRIADFCAGLGGPARYFAHVYGVHVTAIDLNEARIRGAKELTRLAGLEGRVEMRLADVTASGLPGSAFDAVVSQEAFLHVHDKAAALCEASRVLKPGGRMVFTDWVMHSPLDALDADLLWRGLAARTLCSIARYRDLLTGAGFSVVGVEDLTSEWAVVLQARHAMYLQLREESGAAGLPGGEDDFYRAYERLVALMRKGVLGGGRFAACREPASLRRQHELAPR